MSQICRRFLISSGRSRFNKWILYSVYGATAFASVPGAVKLISNDDNQIKGAQYMAAAPNQYQDNSSSSSIADAAITAVANSFGNIVRQNLDKMVKTWWYSKDVNNGIGIGIDNGFIDKINKINKINKNGKYVIPDRKYEYFTFTPLPSECSDTPTASKLFWEHLLKAAYRQVGLLLGDCKYDILSHTFPLITYEYQNKIFFINSAQSAQYFIQKFNISEKNDDGNINWDKIPKLCIMPFDIQDSDKIIGQSHEERNFIQSTLGGHGYCAVIMGGVGVGKSSLLNSMLGYSSDNGPFRTSAGFNACTTEITQFSGNECGKIGAPVFTLIDSPGLDDENKTQDELAEIAYNFFRQLYYGPNLFMYAFQVDKVRFTKQDKEQITMLYKMFGKDFAKHLIIVLTMCDPSNKHGKRGWGNKINKLKADYNEKLSELMDGQEPLAIIPVCADEPEMIEQICDIMKKNGLSRFPSRNVQRLRDINENEWKKLFKEMQEEISQLVEKLDKAEKTIENQGKNLTEFAQKIDSANKEIDNLKEDNYQLRDKLLDFNATRYAHVSSHARNF